LREKRNEKGSHLGVHGDLNLLGWVFQQFPENGPRQRAFCGAGSSAGRGEAIQHASAERVNA
jgi:hypothetical protein